MSKRLRLIGLYFIVLLAFLSVANAADDLQAEGKRQRVALVIGNGNYTGGGVLANPANDAKDMAAKLEQLGFSVILHTDAEYTVMRHAFTEFGRQIKTGDVALFFYAGHGMQVRGKNYLLPVDARIQIENDVGTEGMDVDFILDKLNQAGVSIVILDACRNNPFERRFRSGSGAGLAQMAAPTGTLIAYSTSPGKVAADGEGRNGLYTGELLKALSSPGVLQVEDVFKRVRSMVVRLSGDTQIPWEASSLTGNFYFAGRPDSSRAPSSDAQSEEEALWSKLDEKRPCEYKIYLDSYPRGKYAKLANLRADSCDRNLVVSALPPVPATPKPAAIPEAKAGPGAGSDEYAWVQAERTSTTDAYVIYMKSFPAGTFIGQAKAALARLKRNELRRQMGKVFKDCPDCPEMVMIPSARFEMGSSHSRQAEKPVHDVSIVNTYALGRTEVTQGQWQAIMGNNPSRFTSCGENCPVENVSWDDVQVFLQKFNAMTGKQYRLPTEAEWEFAARSQSTTHYSWGDDIGTNNANCDGCGSQWDKRATAPVGSFRPNPLGLHDMHGNVSEWVSDCWNDDYEGAPDDGSAWVYDGCSDRVLRGGSWEHSPHDIRAASRSWGMAGKRVDTRGFRLARTL